MSKPRRASRDMRRGGAGEAGSFVMIGCASEQLGLLAQIDADKLILAAGIEEAGSQRRMCAHAEGHDLRAVAEPVAGGACGNLKEFALFGEHEQLVIHQKNGSRL